MSSLYEMIFGSSPPRPQQPASRGGLLGARYEGMPTTSRLDDRRRAPVDYTDALLNSQTLPGQIYPQTALGGNSPAQQGGVVDPSTTVPSLLDVGDPSGPYSRSFSPKFRPHVQPSVTGGYGPNLPLPLSVPYGVTPGQPGWSTPPSPSGPHPNRAQPQYEGVQPPIYQQGGTPIMSQSSPFGMTLNSAPWWQQ